MKHRSMTVMCSGMVLLSAVLLGALVWILWEHVPWAAVRYTILGLCAAHPEAALAAMALYRMTKG